MKPNAIELTAAVCFAAAILHTFLAGYIRHAAHRFKPNSLAGLSLHLLGEVELVFALWALIFMAGFAALAGLTEALAYFQSVHFGEAIFVFAIMTLMSTQSILNIAALSIGKLARLFPVRDKSAVHFFLCMTLGPLLGSLITEPAAMTVTALLLLKTFYRAKMPETLKYLVLGTLFVNVSVGGTLTHYAAPPVLMVAKAWNWDTPFMFSNFGWKSTLIVLFNNCLILAFFYRAIKKLPDPPAGPRVHPVSWFTDLLRLKGAKVKEAGLVAIFLAGLVVLGGYQRWWLEPVLGGLADFTLFAGATGLTALVDNAALTYLASQVEGLSDAAKYYVVAGAVAGGGLTVIANAPNPAGNAILGPAFGEDGIIPLKLLIGALAPTVIACLVFWVL